MDKEKLQQRKIGITFSTFDLFHAGHVVMLEEAKRHCDWLICGIQLDPTVDRPKTKNKPIQSIIERQIQVGSCKFVDETIVYTTEKELEDILMTLPIDVRIIGDEYRDKNFTGKQICDRRNINIVYNSRDHYMSSTDLRNRIFEAELRRRGTKNE